MMVVKCRYIIYGENNLTVLAESPFSGLGAIKAMQMR